LERNFARKNPEKEERILLSDCGSHFVSNKRFLGKLTRPVLPNFKLPRLTHDACKKCSGKFPVTGLDVQVDCESPNTTGFTRR
jgi:hypothetical protein